MDIKYLRLALERASLGALAVGFVAGFLFSFNPMAVAAIPVTLAYVTKARAAAHVRPGRRLHLEAAAAVVFAAR